MSTFTFRINISVGTEIPVINTGSSFTDLTYDETDIGGGIYEINVHWTAFSRLSNNDGLTFNTMSYKTNTSIDITQFDNIPLANTNYQFYVFGGNFSAIDAPIVSTNTGDLFAYSPNFNSDIGHWDMSNATSMKNMFNNCTIFNQDISSWDVRNVITMENAFANTKAFNQPLNTWSLDSCTTIKAMFNGSVFNQPLNEWDVKTVTHMHYTFRNTTNFNQDINNWDVSGHGQFRGMFSGAKAFNSPLDKWDITSATALDWIFASATAFNQDISSWNTSNITNMNLLFRNATSFNQNLSTWDMSNVTNIRHMFRKATAFNQDITGWNVSNVQDFSYAFSGANSFTYNLGNWNYSSATNLSYMLFGIGYNHNIYSTFVQNLNTNNNIPSDGDFTLIDLYRIDNNDTNTAYNTLVTKGVNFNDAGAYSLEELSIITNIAYTEYIMTSANSGNTTNISGSEEYVLITDPGGIEGNYEDNLDISHSYVLGNPVEMTIYLTSEEVNDVLKIYDTDINGTLLYNMSGNNKQVIDITNISKIYVTFTSNNIYIGNGYTILIKSEAVLSAGICFRKGTPITTDQGIIPINNINPEINTINNEKILFITKTLYNDKLVLIKKHALGKTPIIDTIISKEHIIIYNNKPTCAKNLVNHIDILFIDTENEVLYNVLLEDHHLIDVNGLLAETLHPNNKISEIYNNTKNFNEKMRNNFFNKINTILKINNNINGKY